MDSALKVCFVVSRPPLNSNVMEIIVLIFEDAMDGDSCA
jgi:hypothetical protein